MPDDASTTSPENPPRVEVSEEIAGADQIVRLLALSPRERLQYLLDMLDFEERVAGARVVPGDQ